MAPITQLPSEILTEIFEYYVHSGQAPSYYDHNVCFSRYSSADPRVLGKVCRQWRRTSRSQGSLWSSLYISRPRLGDVKACEQWLRNADSRLLSLYLHQDVVVDDDQAYATDLLLNLFIDYVDAWKVIDLHTFDPYLEATMDRIPALGIIPRHLEEAHLEVKDGQRTGSFPLSRVWATLHASLCLQSVSWFEAFNKVEQLPPNVQWDVLTDLTITSRGLDLWEFTDILNQGHALQTLVVATLKEPTEPQVTQYDASYPLPYRASHKGHTTALTPGRKRCAALNISLNTLAIQSCCVAPTTLFDNLTLPSLQDLSIEFYLPPDAPNLASGWEQAPEARTRPSAFGMFLLRSQCFLRSLKIHDPSLDDTNILAYLSPLDTSLPSWRSVEALSFTGGNISPGCRGITQDIITLLFRHEDDANSLEFLPELRTLELGVCLAEPWYVEAMIQSRNVPYVNLLSGSGIDNGFGEELGLLTNVSIHVVDPTLALCDQVGNPGGW